MTRCVCELVFCFFKGTAWIKDELSSINLGYQFTPVGRKSIGLKGKNKTSRLMTLPLEEKNVSEWSVIGLYKEREAEE